MKFYFEKIKDEKCIVFWIIPTIQIVKTDTISIYFCFLYYSLELDLE